MSTELNLLCSLIYDIKTVAPVVLVVGMVVVEGKLMNTEILIKQN